jgi:hypothetical protein
MQAQRFDFSIRQQAVISLSLLEYHGNTVEYVGSIIHYLFDVFAEMLTEVLLQFSLPGSAYLPGVQHGLELSCSHWFDDWYSLSFTRGKE